MKQHDPCVARKELPMSFPELLPAIQALPRADKLRLAHLLIEELAREEGEPLLEAGLSYPMWSQYDAYEAVPILMHALEQARKES
jgi:hypothetical protein